MIITFSKKFMSGLGDREGTALDIRVLSEADAVGYRHYGGNVYAVITWARGSRVRFTLETKDAWARGSRTAASGRHMRKASWEAHRDVLQALFDLDPDATIRTALATYRGREDFKRQFPTTAHKNVGSVMQPVTFRSTTVLP